VEERKVKKSKNRGNLRIMRKESPRGIKALIPR
jgi:hypothetical protein